MLRIHGQDGRPCPLRRPHDGRACADERLLVGERDGAALGDGREGRLEPRRADDRRDEQIGVPKGGLPHRLGARPCLDPAAGQRLLEVAVAGRIGKRGEFGLELDRPAGERGRIAAARDRYDREAPRRIRDDLRAGPSNRACGAENRYAPRPRCAGFRSLARGARRPNLVKRYGHSKRPLAR